MKLYLKNLFILFLAWRVKHISNKNFILFLSVLIGFLAGIGAVLIKNSVHYIRTFLTDHIAGQLGNYLYFVFPIVGIGLAVLFMKFILKQWVGDGIPNVLYAIARKGGKLKTHNIFSSIITTTLTVGFGGSVGLEGPTVATGAGIGSNIARVFQLSYKETILLLGAAATAAMAAIFKAPITGVVYVLEILMLDLTLTSLIALLFASVTAVLTSFFFLGKDVVYAVDISFNFDFGQIPYFIILGILGGLFGLYYFKTFSGISRIFDKIKSWALRLFIGGSILGILLYLFPSLYGEGYGPINMALHGDYSYLFSESIFPTSNNPSMLLIIGLFFITILLKVVTMTLTFKAGGIGGVFAPTLFVGANLGLIFGLFINYYFDTNYNVSIFALLGMAATISSVLHGPLTAIFLIAEITNGYGLFIPLMIVAVISYFTIQLFERYSIYTYQLAKKGELLTQNKDQAVLKILEIQKHLEINFITCKLDDSLSQLIPKIEESKRNLFPVIGEDNTFHGVVVFDDLRKVMFKTELYDKIKVKDIMITLNDDSIAEISRDSMEDVVNKFSATNNYNLPVLQNGHYLGFVSRANILTSYRKMIHNMTKES